MSEEPQIPQHPLLDLANHYYAVAADLEQNSLQQLQISEQLKLAADKYCEQASRETK